MESLLKQMERLIEALMQQAEAVNNLAMAVEQMVSEDLDESSAGEVRYMDGKPIK